MTWYVKAREYNGVVYPILCDEPMQVFDNLKEQRSRGLEAWIEDHDGKLIDETHFAMSDRKAE